MTTNTGRLATTLFSIAVTVVLAGDVRAHVRLDAPDGGEAVEAGSTLEVTWTVVIEHSTLDWDLWYSTTGPDGPWIPVAEDLAVGDPTAGSMHSFTWTVPDTPSDQVRVRVRVRQDNSGMDYEDVSDSDLSILSGLFVDGFETGDTTGWSIATP